MSEISWVKITVDMFDNRKIKQIRGLPEGNNIVLVWIMLLTIAGRCNAGGMIFLTENIAYTAESLARELDFEVPFIKMAIDTLSHFGMIRCDSSEFSIVNWEEYQNVDGMERVKKLNRERQKRWYDKQKELPNVSPNVNLTQPNGTDIDTKEKEEEKENITVPNGTVCRTKDVRRVLQAWNDVPDLPHIVKIDPESKRGGMLRSRINSYGVESVIQAIENIKNSSFLRGQNKNSFQATFDWFIKPNNFIKVLEGNYADKSESNIKDKTNNIFLQIMEEENGQSANVTDFGNS